MCNRGSPNEAKITAAVRLKNIAGDGHRLPFACSGLIPGTSTFTLHFSPTGVMKDSQAMQEMIAALVEHHVSVDPTLMAFRTKFWGDDSRYINNPRRAVAPPKLWAGFARRSNTADWTADQYRAARAQWPKLLALVKRMYDRGVLLTVGTDTPFPWIVPGVSFHEELRLLAEAGIPAAAVIRMATINAGLALKQNIGSVEAGKEADVIILAANPLESLQNTERIEIVIKAGQLYKP